MGIAVDARRGRKPAEGEGGEGEEGKGGRKGGRGKMRDCTVAKLKDKFNTMVAKAEEKGTALQGKLAAAEAELAKAVPVCEDVEIPVSPKALKFFAKRLGCG